MRACVVVRLVAGVVRAIGFCFGEGVIIHYGYHGTPIGGPRPTRGQPPWQAQCERGNMHGVTRRIGGVKLVWIHPKTTNMVA